MTTVRIYPTGRAYIDGVPAVVQDVTPQRAEELLAYRPAAFVLEDPDAPPSPRPAPAGKPKSSPLDEGKE